MKSINASMRILSVAALVVVLGAAVATALFALTDFRHIQDGRRMQECRYEIRLVEDLLTTGADGGDGVPSPQPNAPQRTRETPATLRQYRLAHGRPFGVLNTPRS